MPPIQNPEVVQQAHQRIVGYLHQTPILQSETLNEMLQCTIYFKADVLQKTGAFKIRGVLNHLLHLKEHHQLPAKIVAYSTGNHGIGLSWAARRLGILARIYLPRHTALVKQQAAVYYGAEVIYTENRQEAEARAQQDIANGFYYLHPSDSDTTIAGAGTACYEALQQIPVRPDAIFAACGGGGLLSGTYLAKQLCAPQAAVVGVEPITANDAYLSLQNKTIFKFEHSPETIADGLKTLCISERIFEYLQHLDDFFLIQEHDIFYWTAWLIHLLKVACEPSCALTMAAACQWLSKQSPGHQHKTILIILSGGNIDPILYRALWKEDYLSKPPLYFCDKQPNIK
jgi:threonine dehydratase